MSVKRFYLEIRLLLKKFKNMPIFFKLLSIIALVFILMTTLSFATFSVFKNSKKLSTLAVVKQNNLETIDKIDNYIKDIKNATKFPLTIKQQNINYITELDNSNSSNVIGYNLQRLDDEMFNDIFGYKDEIHSVFMFNINGYGDYNMDGSVYKPFNPVNEKWFKTAVNSFGSPVIISTYKIPFTTENIHNPVYVFSVARGILKLQTAKVIGVILVNIKIDFLRNTCKKILISPGQRIVIIDKNKNVIYDTNESNITKKLDSNLQKIKWNTCNETKNIKIDGKDMLASFASSKLSGWCIINLIPTNELFKDINKFKYITVFITIIIILIAVILIFLISKQIVNPLSKLVLLMNLVENENFDVKINIPSKDEVGALAKSFNSMTKKIKSLVNEVYLDNLKQKELELQMLQNQINPHFLYNTLESISMMATINDDEKTSDMAAALGSILRYGISKKETKVTVSQEINNIKDYIMLQECRFKNIYEITVNVDENIYDYYITKLILQPVIENAIYHGMSSIRSGGKIQVYGYALDSTLIFEITDNGKGMNEQETLKLNEYINELNESLKSIGLRNVNKRIQLNYGDNYGIVVYSKLGIGTKVQVTIPIEKIDK